MGRRLQRDFLRGKQRVRSVSRLMLSTVRADRAPAIWFEMLGKGRHRRLNR